MNEKMNKQYAMVKYVAETFREVGVVAGGAVIDTALGKEIKDIDLFVAPQMELLARNVINKLESNGLEVSNFEHEARNNYASSTTSSFTFETPHGKCDIEVVYSQILPHHDPRFDFDSKKSDMLLQLGERVKEGYNQIEFKTMNEAFGRMMTMSFDLNIKKGYVSPLTLDFVILQEALEDMENERITFNPNLEMVTPKNIVRAVDAETKYGFSANEQHHMLLDLMTKAARLTTKWSFGADSYEDRLFKLTGAKSLEKTLITHPSEEEMAHYRDASGIGLDPFSATPFLANLDEKALETKKKLAAHNAASFVESCFFMSIIDVVNQSIKKEITTKEVLNEELFKQFLLIIKSNISILKELREDHSFFYGWQAPYFSELFDTFPVTLRLVDFLNEEPEPEPEPAPVHLMARMPNPFLGVVELGEEDLPF